MDYYVKIKGQTKGPYKITQLRQMWNSGVVNGRTPYCQEGMSEWLPLGHMQFHLESEPEPVAASQALHTPTKRPRFRFNWRVCLACVGFLGVLVALRLGAAGGNSAKTADDLKFDAYYTATKKFVSAQLPAPHPAKFADFGDCTVTVEAEEYTVTGWVDTQNSSGTVIRQNFVCKLRLDASRGKWVQIDTSIF